MHKWLLVALLAGAPELMADRQEVDANVNSRYTVESVNLSSRRSKLSAALRGDLDRLVGAKLDHTLLQRVAARIQRELRVSVVDIKVTRGAKADHVAVEFELERPQHTDFDINVPKFLYHSRQGWSAVTEATIKVHDNAFTFGLGSDGDAKLERFAGVLARYERKSIGTDRLGLRFDFESYHQQWNRATLEALGGGASSPGAPVPGIYRTRQNFAPTGIVTLARPLALEFGVSVQRFESQYPVARTESANAVVSTLRYQPRWEDSDGNKHSLEASYNLRAATNVFDSDYVYSRHLVEARYGFKRGDSNVSLAFAGGRMEGRAPLFERFILGNANTLRGWNKFDLDPIGSSRIAHGSVEFVWHGFMVFYDTGAMWDKDEEKEQKHAAGLGFHARPFQLAVAFPIKKGRAVPVFYAGMNF